MDLAQIEAPGTLDGGDVCDADGQFLIGLSARTNEHGAGQLAAWLAELGYASNIIDLRANDRLLHLKTGLTYIGDGRIVATADVPDIPALAAYERIPVAETERYAANCIRVNDQVLVAAGYPRLADALADCGYDLIPLEMSEFRKMDGGPSCLSLRF
jgi:dimethylargininase